MKKSFCKIFILFLFFLCACKFIYAQYEDNGNETISNETKSVGYDWEYGAKITNEEDEMNETYGDMYKKDYSSQYVNNQYTKRLTKKEAAAIEEAARIKAPKTHLQQVQELSVGSNNPYDPESVTDLYGRYGSMYSPDRLYNPMSQYKSSYNSTADPYVDQVLLVYGNTTLDAEK